MGKTSDIIMDIDSIKVIIHAPTQLTTEEENKMQLAKYLYKLIEMDKNFIQQ